jgi:hypothetical protein
MRGLPLGGEGGSWITAFAGMTRCGMTKPGRVGHGPLL